jgi:hypothetical protein
MDHLPRLRGRSQQVSKKLLSDYPRGLRNGFACWWFSASDAFPVTPALPVTLLFARRRGPIALLSLPPRPGPRRLPALLAAIALPPPSRAKPLLTTFEQTPPGPRGSSLPTCPFSPAALLIFGMACRTLGRAQGRSLLPEAPAPEGIALLSGAQQIFASIRDQQLYRKDRIPRDLVSKVFSVFPARGRRGCDSCRPVTIVSLETSLVRLAPSHRYSRVAGLRRPR